MTDSIHSREADASALYDKLRTLNSLLVGLPVSVPPDSLKDPKTKRLLSGAKTSVMTASQAVDALADYIMGLDTEAASASALQPEGGMMPDEFSGVESMKEASSRSDLVAVREYLDFALVRLRQLQFSLEGKPGATINVEDLREAELKIVEAKAILKGTDYYLSGIGESAHESTLTGSQKAVIKQKIDAAVKSTLDAMGDLEADPSLSQVKATLDRAAKMLQSVSSRGIEARQTTEQFVEEITSVEEFQSTLRDASSDIMDAEESGRSGDWTSAASSLRTVADVIGSTLDYAVRAKGGRVESQRTQSPLQHFVEAGVLKAVARE